MTDLIERPQSEVAPAKGAKGKPPRPRKELPPDARRAVPAARADRRRASRSGATSRAASTTARRAARTRRSSSARTSRSRTRTPRRSSRPRRRSGRRPRRASGSRSTAASSRASRARRSSRSAATTGSRSRRCATSRSCPASGRAGCASSTSRARSTRRSRARGTCDDGMVVQTQTEEIRRLRRTNLELIFSDHNAYCLPPCQNKCPSHIDIPGFLKQNAEGNFRESTRIFKRTIPFPSVLGRVCPAPCEEHCRRDEVDEAIAIRDSHRYAGDMVIKSMLDDEPRPADPVRAAAGDRPPRGRDRLRARRAWPRPTTCCSRATTSPSSSATRRRAGCSATASRSTACRRSRSSRPSTRASTRLGGKIVCNQGLGRDFTLDDLQYQGFDAIVIAIGCYDTNKLGIPGEDAPEVLDGLEYLRTATLGLPYPNHEGKRVVVIGGGFTSMDCSRTSDPPGREGGDPRLPPRHEGHARVERGPRGDRGGRHRHLPGRPRPGRHGQGQQRHRRRVHPDEARRARRVRPAPPRARARHRVHDPVRPRAARDRPGAGARLDRARAPPARRRRRTSASRPTRSRSRPAGPACSAPATSGSAPRPWSRRSPRAAARRTRSTRSCAATTSRPSAPARRSPSPSRSSCRSCPSPSEVKEPRYRMKAMEAEERKHSYVEYEFPYSREEIVSRVDALPPVHVRGDRVLRPAPPRDRVRDDADDARAEPARGRRASAP